MRAISVFACAITLVFTVAGCSGGGKQSSTPTRATVTTSTTGTVVSDLDSPASKEAAIALGHRMLDGVVLPAGARPFTGRAPSGEHAPYEFPGARNLVFAHRLWTVNQPPHAVWQWLQAHIPRGFAFPASGYSNLGSVRTWMVEADLAVAPVNVSQAQLQLGIGGKASGPAVIRADTIVGWTKPRPADEFVPTADRTVIVTVIHISRPSRPAGPFGKRVTTSDPKLVQPLVRTFNRLHVIPPEPNPGGPPGCGSVVYRVAFSTSSTATPDVVATVGRCGGVDVTVNGHTKTELDDLPRQVFATDAAHVIGLSEPHWG